MLIYPSILEQSADDLFDRLTALSPFFSHFQIDITDGIFVPGKTVQIEEIVENVAHYTLPVTRKTFEFHLMVNDYKLEIDKINQLVKFVKIDIVLIHLQSLKTKYEIPNIPTSNRLAAFTLRAGSRSAVSPEGSLTLCNLRDDEYTKYQIGLVLNPEDDVVSNWETIKQFATVQLMTVYPGAQGTPFVPKTLDKIDELRDCGFSGKIILDGAINDKTLPIILTRKNRPDAVCPGSYFKIDIKERLERLKKLLY